MQKSQSKAPSGGFSVQDVIYIVFKHKWKIVVLSLLGFAAAAAVFLNQKPLYASTAKLLVRYVIETGAVDPYSEMKSPGGGAKRGSDPVILTEMEILRSLDLAKDVAAVLRAENPQSGVASPGLASQQDAAMAILGKLMVFPGESPNVLYLSYANEDKALPKTTLEKIVELYFKRHLEIHRSAAAFDTVSSQTEEVRRRLEQTEKELNALRTDTGIVSLADAIAVLSGQKAKTQEDLMQSKASLAEQLATIDSLTKAGAAAEAAAAGPVSSDPTTGSSKAGKPAKDPANQPPSQVITEFRTVMELLSFLQKRDVELRIKFKTGSRLLSQNQQQIESYEARRRGLIEKYPDLVNEVAALTSDPKDPRRNLDTERARLAAITAKIEVLKTHLEEISDLFKEQYAIGARIESLDRRKQMEDAEYRSLEQKLKDAKLRQTLDPASMPNITLVQTPSEPIKTYDLKVNKIAMGLAGGGIAIGLGLAFLIELLFDRRVKRPTEIQTRLQLPLLLSIPYIRPKDRGGLMLSNESSVPRIGQGGDMKLSLPGEPGASGLGVGRSSHFIHRYAETIRDRIIFNFEINNLTHKPKLVAVTGLSEGAGASTVAAGLAKSFSDLSGVKVLLVDLSSMHPEESPIFGEVHRHSLNGALQLAGNSKFRESADSLYYASATARRDDSGLTTFSPMHLYELMPQLQASDFDYIIFDMPPINQTSRTLTMAGLMDKVLLVLDADNTSRDALKWGYSELEKGKADVSCIFNKTRSHAPSWVLGDS
jgi:polysaccharide biosynthesis transport protein